jgi:spore maturation protein SpmA
MVLNYIWIAFFVIAFVIAVVRLLFMGDTGVFPAIINSTFETSKTAFEISLGLTGVLALWLGVMRIGEKGGVIDTFARWLSPIFTKLFPEIPKDHPVVGNIFMNLSANMLGLDNAATPLGLKAMERLQELNPKKDTASNAMIMFLVLNTSGLTLIPVSIMVYRAQMGAQQPTDIFIPILLATFFSTLVGIIVTSLFQRINLINKTVLLTLGGACLVVAGVIWTFAQMDGETMGKVSTLVANILLMTIIVGFIIAGVRKKVNVYDAFIEGAKDGFHTAVRIIPYLVAVLVGIILVCLFNYFINKYFVFPFNRIAEAVQDYINRRRSYNVVVEGDEEIREFSENIREIVETNRRLTKKS